MVQDVSFLVDDVYSMVDDVSSTLKDEVVEEDGISALMETISSFTSFILFVILSEKQIKISNVFESLTKISEN